MKSKLFALGLIAASLFVIPSANAQGFYGAPYYAQVPHCGGFAPSYGPQIYQGSGPLDSDYYHRHHRHWHRHY